MFESFQPELLRTAYEAYSTSAGRDNLARECRSKVLEWRWANGDMACAYGLKRPFVKELHRSAPKWLKADAKPKYGNLRHGLDAQGVIHVVVDPSFGEKETNEAEAAWKYLVYGEGQIETVRYRYTHGRLEHLQRFVYDGERLIRQHMLMHGDGSETHYFWGERLDRILSMGWRQRFHSDSRSWTDLNVTSHTEQLCEYDPLGRLECIVERSLNEDGTVYKGLSPRVRYQRPRKAESIRALAADIERMLLDQVPSAVAGVKPTGPFYCVLLCYCGEDFQAGWPPYLMLGSESWRQQVVRNGDQVPYFLWAPGEMEGHPSNLRLNLPDMTLNKTCELHTLLMEAKDDYSAARKVLRSVTKSLNVLDWANILEITPDFLVAAVDDHGETDPAQDIKAVIPPAKFRSLRREGLL